MTRTQMLLTILAEECSEVARELNDMAIRVSKAIRFGLDEVQYGQVETNRERIENLLLDAMHEMNDLYCVAAMLGLTNLGTVPDMRKVAEKQQRVIASLKQSAETDILEKQ